jgi:hypothetical protein
LKFDKRAALEKLLKRVANLGGLKVFPPFINMQDKKYTGAAKNEHDNWNRNCFLFLAGKLRHIDDQELNLLFGKGANGVRERAELLMDGGNSFTECTKDLKIIAQYIIIFLLYCTHAHTLVP